jgi:cytidylate kinase
MVFQRNVRKQILIIEREYGCGAAEIAQKAAQRLGWRLLDHELTEEIARVARADPAECARREEQLDSWLYRLGKVFWRGSYEHTLSLEGPEILDADRMMALVQQIIAQAAETGNCVIVGRGAPYFLRHRLDTFTVFLYASRQIKLARVEAQMKNRARAEELVDSVDQNRAAFIKHYFGRDWPNRHLYHLMLNTGLGIDATVDLILHTMDIAAKGEPALAMD